MNRIIYVRNITYGFYGKNDHIFPIKKDETFLSLKEKIRKHFKIDTEIEIEMFDDNTEQLIDDDDQITSITSITFSEK